ncbi:hypothetical protein [Pseudanabaena sp. UWO310]|uniref:hypothetical protein n=1 Tax=Pseudanabaena sp. UWO310 TaxID=2480795 RepID=UPI00168197E4|nr:hypothetical protein [Pseudanabaena sp. UWO310]
MCVQIISLYISQTLHNLLYTLLSPAITVRAVNLSPIHKDPFDRLIIATALEYDAKIASFAIQRKLDQSSVRI